MMKVHLGTEGGTERVILCTAPGFIYMAVRVFGRYYRFAAGYQIPGFVYMGRS